MKIQDQPFRALLTLLDTSGEIVSREELRQKLWPNGTFVDFEGSLNVILKRLRASLDYDPDTLSSGSKGKLALNCVHERYLGALRESRVVGAAKGKASLICQNQLHPR